MAVLARVSKLAITITTIFTISMVCLATNTEPKLAALLSLVREHATPRKVIHLLGNPQYCFLPDADKGFAGKADQVVFRYEHLLKEQLQTDVQVWVVLGKVKKGSGHALCISSLRSPRCNYTPNRSEAGEVLFDLPRCQPDVKISSPGNSLVTGKGNA